MHYRYVKANIRVATPRKKKKLPKFTPYLLIFIGIMFVLSAIFPIISYQLFLSPDFSSVISPVSTEVVLGDQTTEVDYTRASNWFPEAPKLPALPSRITHYNLSIPKLKINEATVEIGGEDLKKSLIHYPGTALPGQFGNAVLFGHSSLPQLFSPKNYSTIFTTLPSLKIGDEIFVNFDGIIYKYLVEQMFEVTPDDISILQQRYDDSYLTLITCVPPGTYMRRLVVRTRLKSI